MKKHTPLDWAVFFGIEIVDIDGWRTKGSNFYEPTSLLDFANRVNVSTIMIVDHTKYKNFLFIVD